MSSERALNALDAAGAIPEGRVGHPHLLKHRQIQIAKWHHAAHRHMLPGLESSTATAADQDGKIVRIVPIAIRHARTENNHAMVKQIGIPFRDRLQFAEETGELFRVPAIDALVLSDFRLIVFVVR